MRKLVVATALAAAIALATATSAVGQIYGKQHSAKWQAVGNEYSPSGIVECELFYQSVAYPGTSERTVNFNAEFHCTPVGIYRLNGNVIAHVNGQNISFAHFSCQEWPTGCAGPNNPVNTGGSVRVPADQRVTWDLANVMLVLAGEDLNSNPGVGGLDPWVTVPILQLCRPLTLSSECLRPFTSHDPESWPLTEVG
jgi:hypothetical protein